MDAAARLALREAEARPVLAALKAKLHGWKGQLLPKHPMAEAVNYALNQWAALASLAELVAILFLGGRHMEQQRARRRPPAGLCPL